MPTITSEFALFYTSGSTGAPKGTIVTYGNILNSIHWWKDNFSLKSTDISLLFSSLSFVMSLRQFLPVFCTGGRIIIPATSIEYADAITTYKVNKLISTASALATLDIQNIPRGQIESVQVGGEAPSIETIMFWKQFVHHIFISLSCTELSGHSICCEYDGSDDINAALVVGHPVSNCRVYIVDSVSGCQQPIGVPGK